MPCKPFRSAFRRLAIALTCCLGTAGAHAYTNDADCLMDWAESLAPSLLSPAHQTTQALGTTYSFRAYPNTGVLFGVGEGNVVAIGGALGYQLRTLGTTASFLPAARAANCGGTSATVNQVCTQMVVPAYFYATKAAWTTLTKNTTPLIAIANVNTGPGTTVDSQFTTTIQAARAAGHRVKGYIYTSYGTRSSADVLADMEAWSKLYGVNDYFLDEVSALAADLPYYRTVLQTAYAKNSSRRFMLNPGAAPDKAYFSIVPNVEIVVYEAAWSKYTANSLPAWLDEFASQSWIMALNASQAQMQEAANIARQRKFAGFFATDVSTFTAGLPSYWTQETAQAGCR